MKLLSRVNDQTEVNQDMLSKPDIENFYQDRGIGWMPAECENVFLYFDSGEFTEVYEAVWELFVVPGTLKLMGDFFREEGEERLTGLESEVAQEIHGSYEDLLHFDPGVFRHALLRVPSATALFLLVEGSIDDLWSTYLPIFDQSETARARSFKRWLCSEMDRNPIVHDEFVSRGWKPHNGTLEETASAQERREATERMYARFKHERHATAEK